MFEKLTRVAAWVTLWICLCLAVGILSSAVGGAAGHAAISFGTVEITSETPDGGGFLVVVVLWTGSRAAGILLRDRMCRWRLPIK